MRIFCTCEMLGSKRCTGCQGRSEVDGDDEKMEDGTRKKVPHLLLVKSTLLLEEKERV